MTSLNTVTVTGKITLLYGNKGSTPSPLTVLNLDTSNTVYVGNDPTIVPNVGNAIPLGPLASMTFDGSVSVFAVTTGPSIQIAIMPGGNAYSPGALNISGPVTATISGPVTVNGSVGITGTPNVNIANTPSVSISGTPTVTISGTPAVTISSGTVTATISGTSNVNITNATVNVGGSVAISPTVALLASDSSGQTMAGPSSVTLMSLVNVQGYNSYNILTSATDTNQATAGHCLTYQVILTWFADAAGTFQVAQETWNPWVSTLTETAMGNGPMRGPYMSARVNNLGAHSFTLNPYAIFGSDQTVPNSDWDQPTGNHTSDSSLHLLNTIGVGSDNILADAGAQLPLAASTGYWMPLNLGTGAVYIAFTVSATISSAQILDIGSSAVAAGNISGTTSVLYNFSTGTTGQQINLILPRSACALKVTTTTSAANMQFTATLQR